MSTPRSLRTRASSPIIQLLAAFGWPERGAAVSKYAAVAAVCVSHAASYSGSPYSAMNRSLRASGSSGSAASAAAHAASTWTGGRSGSGK